MTVLVALVVGVLLFRRTKRRLLEVQNALVLIPLLELSVDQRGALEKFLST